MQINTFMKAILIFTVLLFTLHGNNCSAQTGWIWGVGQTQSDPLGYTEALASSIDKDGNIFTAVTTTCDSAHFGSFVVRNTGHQPKLVVTKVDTAGHVLWVFGTKKALASPSGMVCDTAGNTYVYGIFRGDSIDVGGTILHSSFSFFTDFLIKLSPTGSVIWTKTVAGTNYGSGPSIPISGPRMGIDKAGYLYLHGYFSVTTPIVIGTTTMLSRGYSDGYLAKYDQSGNVIWATSYGAASGTEIAVNIAVSSKGNIYGSGYFTSDTLIIAGDTLYDPYLTSIGTKAILNYLVKFDSSGRPVWGQAFDKRVHLSAVALDAIENLYTVGRIDSSIILGTDTLISAGDRDVLTMKFDSSGLLKWARSAGGTGSDYGNSIAVDSCRNVWINGAFGGRTGYTINFSGHTLVAPGGVHSDAMFLVEYDHLGNFVNSTTLDCGGDDYCGILMDSRGNIGLAGDMTWPMIVAHDTLYFDTTTTTSETFFNARYNYRLESCVFHDSVTHIDSSYLHVKQPANNPNAVTIYPNPATYEFTISSNGTFTEGTVASVYDMTGRLIASYLLSGTSVTISLHNFLAGLYPCKIANGNSMYTVRKLVVIK